MIIEAYKAVIPKVDLTVSRGVYLFTHLLLQEQGVAQGQFLSGVPPFDFGVFFFLDWLLNQG